MQQGLKTGQDGTRTGADAAGAAGGAREADVERDVRRFLADNFILDEDGQDVEALPGDASLTERAVLDSMGVLELVMFIEDRYGIKVPDEDTVPENLDSVDRIVGYVRGRTSN